MSDIRRKSITLLTNATLFNVKNWDLIKDVYDDISVQVSIDAATKETYQKLRCGNFDYLIKNLKMLGCLRKKGNIRHLQYNFVVQRDNYKEMIDFLGMAKKFNVDVVQFTKLNNWGTFSRCEYSKKSLIVKKKYLDYDFYKLLKCSIFNDKMVDLSSFDVLISNSEKYYDK